MKEPSEPFQTKQFAIVIESIHTEFILSSFSDHLFFVITQYDKLGTIVSKECVINQKLRATVDVTPDGDKTFSVLTLLGKKEETLEVYARRIIEVTSKKSSKPLVLSIALKKPTPTTFKEVVVCIEKNISL